MLAFHTHWTGPVHVEQTQRFLPTKANFVVDRWSDCDEELASPNSFRRVRMRVFVWSSKFANDSDEVESVVSPLFAATIRSLVDGGAEALSSISGHSKENTREFRLSNTQDFKNDRCHICPWWGCFSCEQLVSNCSSSLSLYHLHEKQVWLSRNIERISPKMSIRIEDWTEVTSLPNSRFEPLRHIHLRRSTKNPIPFSSAGALGCVAGALGTVVSPLTIVSDGSGMLVDGFFSPPKSNDSNSDNFLWKKTTTSIVSENESTPHYLEIQSILRELFDVIIFLLIASMKLVTLLLIERNIVT